MHLKKYIATPFIFVALLVVTQSNCMEKEIQRIKKDQAIMLTVLLEVQNECHAEWYNMSDVQRKVTCYPVIAQLQALQKQSTPSKKQ
jgi:hypothetical protein